MPRRLPAKIVSVITADVVRSRRIPARVLESRMAEVANLIASTQRRKKMFELYRGDSFQAIADIRQALRIAILWRAALKATPGKYRWDIRISIGFGDISHRGKTLAASGGDAFQRSGELLDSMKHGSSQLIAFNTGNEVLNSSLNIECMLAEGIISRWTPAGAEAIFNVLLYDETQEKLAARMGITQPAVHKRLQAAGWVAIRQWVHYFTGVLNSILFIGRNKVA